MAMLKEFRSVEFFQKGAVWNAGLLNTWAQNGKPAKPGLINLPLNSKLKHRTIYAYLWAKASVDPAANFCYVFCNLNLNLGGQTQFVFPLNYGIGSPSVLTTAQADLNLQKTYFSLPLSGGLAAQRTIAFQVYDVQAANFNQETVAAQLMQPFPCECEADQISVDLLGWGNVDITNIRCVLLSIAV